MFAHSCWGYKAQIMHLGDDVFNEEKRIINSILKIPHQAFGAHVPFDLSFVGLPDLRSLRVLNVASFTRASNKTLKSWLPGFHRLVESAETNLTPHSIAHNMFCSGLWDSVPSACNLWLYHASNPLAWQHLANVTSVDARRGLVSVVPTLSPSWKHLQHSCDHALAQLHDALKDDHKYQRAISRLLKPLLHPVCWSNYLSQRLKAYCPRNDVRAPSIELIDKFNWEKWATCLKTMSPFSVSHVLRTCLNSWITSFRIINGSQQFKCMFCGSGSDHLSHYISCPKLWGHLHDITGLDFAGPIVQRLGLSTNKLFLSCIAFASYFYHTVRAVPTSCDRFIFHIKAFNFAAKANIPIRSHCFPCKCTFGIRIPIDTPYAPSDPNYDYDVFLAAAAASGSAPAAAAAPDATSTCASLRPPGDAVEAHQHGSDGGHIADHWESLFFSAMGFWADDLVAEP